MNASIQTDHVNSPKLWKLLQEQEQHMEQEKQQDKRRHSGGDGTSTGLITHYQHQQDPDAIHRLSDAGDIVRFEQDQTLSRNPSFGSKVKAKQHQAKISFARGSKSCSDTKSCGSNGSGSKGKHLAEQSSLSDRICQVVWSRKESAPFVSPLGSRRVAHNHRRGTAPNVPLMRQNSEPRPDAFGGRSQSFKGLILIWLNRGERRAVQIMFDYV